MKVIGFDGKEHKLNWSKYAHKRKRSAPHQSAFSLLSEMFPGYGIYEEITLPGSKRFNSPALYADLFLPHIPMMVEVHGRQHYEMVPFFHKDKKAFLMGRKADRDKKEWCSINDITYVELPYDKEEEWKTLILTALSQ